MTGGTCYGVVTREAHVMEEAFTQDYLGGVCRHVEWQRHNGFL
jgi:hypothetical protein